MKNYRWIFICLFLLVGLNKTNAQNKSEEPIYTIVDEMPQFNGGEEGLKKYLIENIKYPNEAKKTGVEGVVYVSFYVDTDGKVKNGMVMKGVNLLLDQEALRVVNAMPVWTPGKQDGKTVKVQYNLPIRFSLTVPDKKNKSK